MQPCSGASSPRPPPPGRNSSYSNAVAQQLPAGQGRDRHPGRQPRRLRPPTCSARTSPPGPPTDPETVGRHARWRGLVTISGVLSVHPQLLQGLRAASSTVPDGVWTRPISWAATSRRAGGRPFQQQLFAHGRDHDHDQPLPPSGSTSLSGRCKFGFVSPFGRSGVGVELRSGLSRSAVRLSQTIWPSRRSACGGGSADAADAAPVPCTVFSQANGARISWIRARQAATHCIVQ